MKSEHDERTPAKLRAFFIGGMIRHARNDPTRHEDALADDV